MATITDTVEASTCQHLATPRSSGADGYDQIGRCPECSLALLKLWFLAPTWVHRRVESVEFIDDRTVRRRVSVDFDVPPAPQLVGVDGDQQQQRILPIAMLRRKTLVNFDLVDEAGRSRPLLGLRQNQALCSGVLRFWADRSLQAAFPSDPPQQVQSPTTEKVLLDLVQGDQRQLAEAYAQLRPRDTDGPADPQLRALGRDEAFMVVAERLAEEFVLFLPVEGAVGTRRIVKYGYDERLSLRYRDSGYVPESSGRSLEAEYEPNQPPLKPWARPQLAAALGWRPTVVRFPVPAAESCASFHFSLSVPPSVVITEATLLAGRPKQDPPWDGSSVPVQRRLDLMPVDRTSGALPSVDLHVVDVPLGSLSRAQVALQAEPRGWLAATAVACASTAAVLLAAAGLSLLKGRADPAASSTLLVAFAAGTTAIFALPQQHRMAARLLHAVRQVAFLSVAPAIALSALLAFKPTSSILGSAEWVAAAVSLVFSAAVVGSWWRANRRFDKDDKSHLLRMAIRGQSKDLDMEEFRWEQSKDRVPSARTDDLPTSVFDHFAKKYGLDRPAVRVASSEGTRKRFPWDPEFQARMMRRLGDVPGQGGPTPAS